MITQDQELTYRLWRVHVWITSGEMGAVCGQHNFIYTVRFNDPILWTKNTKTFTPVGLYLFNMHNYLCKMSIVFQCHFQANPYSFAASQHLVIVCFNCVKKSSVNILKNISFCVPRKKVLNLFLFFFFFF